MTKVYTYLPYTNGYFDEGQQVINIIEIAVKVIFEKGCEQCETRK